MTTKLLLTHVLTAVVGAAVTLLTLRACGGLPSDPSPAEHPGEARHDTIVVERLRVDTVRIEHTTERLRTVERIPDKCLNLEGYSQVRLNGTRGTFNGKASEMCDPGNVAIRATIDGVEALLVVDMQSGASVISGLIPNNAKELKEMRRSDPKAWRKIVIGNDTVREIMVKDYVALSHLAQPDVLYEMVGEVSYIPFFRLYAPSNVEKALQSTSEVKRGYGVYGGILRDNFLFDHSAIIDFRNRILYYKPGYDLPKGQKPPYPKELY